METFDQNLPVVEISSEEASTINDGYPLVVLYNDINFGSREADDLYSTDKSVPYVGDKFNNKASSFIIVDGTWDFYTDKDFKGSKKRLGPGKYPWVEAVGIPNDKISSIKLIGNY